MTDRMHRIFQDDKKFSLCSLRKRASTHKPMACQGFDKLSPAHRALTSGDYSIPGKSRLLAIPKCAGEGKCN